MNGFADRLSQRIEGQIKENESKSDKKRTEVCYTWHSHPRSG